MNKATYYIVVDARNYAIDLKVRKKHFNNHQIDRIKRDFMYAKEQVIEHARFLLIKMEENNIASLEFIWKYRNKIMLLENKICAYNEARNFEYVIPIDFRIITQIMEAEDSEAVILNEDPEKVKRQLEILVDSISLLNKAIVIFMAKQVDRNRY